ncbi:MULTISPECIES: DUF5071 domain-containing protein [unclassified Bradyrhizobium]|uniref:DUF5071 domain-containing protein n=1 Tax=unclassified Bradyrhizobium TaxID=2631580 RepID=UPI0028EEEB44|nr:MULTISPECIES: DUF5071 domain-containing protein [unclassified Bradyrhizobium]
MDDISRLLPRSKNDIDGARAVVQAGYPAVAPILGELTVWLKDYNWPIAHLIAPFLSSIGTPMVPHIWHVLKSDDHVWKYWIIELLLLGLPQDTALEFRPELERLCYTPSDAERREELDQQARQVLAHFGWV